MPFYGQWTKEEKKKLRGLWNEAKKDKEKFKGLCQGDPDFSQRGDDQGWPACDMMARRMHFYKGMPSMVTAIEKEPPEKIARINKDLADPNIIWKEVEESSGHSRNTLRHYARKLGLTINKRDAKAIAKAFDTRLAELIKNGGLHNSAGMQGLYDILKSEFQSQAQSFSPESFAAKAHDVMWDKTTLETLDNCIRLDLPFGDYHKYIPASFVDEKTRERTGKSTVVSSVKFIPGLARLLDDSSTPEDEHFELPRSTFNKPFKIPTRRPNWTISCPNAPNIGTIHSRLMSENPLRRAFADAEKRGDIALFLANIIDLNIVKASGAATKVFRSLFSGLNINLDIIDPDYREQASQILKDSPKDAVIYETIAESFAGIMSGLRKILNANNKLQYSGQIYVIFTRKEQDIIAKVAYMEERYITIVKIAQLNQKKTMLENAIADADDAEVDALETKLEAVTKELSRTIISLVHTQEDRRLYRRVLAFVVRKFEEALGPNCKVIGMGTSHFEVGGCLIEGHIPDNEKPTDTNLLNYVRNFGAKSLRRQMPDAVVIFHPCALGGKETERERYVEGQRLMPTKIFVAPSLVDAKFLRQAMNNSARFVHNLAKAVRNDQFMPGLLRLEYCNGDINPIWLSIDSLAPHERKKNLKDSRLTYGGKFFNLMFATDPHWGGRSKVFVYDRDNSRKLGMAEATMEIMRRSGLFQSGKMRVHGFAMLDDPTQGHNFDTHYQPSPNQMDYVEIEDHIRNVAHRIEHSVDLEEIKKLSAEKDEFMRYQIQVRGLDYPEHQIKEVLRRHIMPNVDFFNALLSRVVDANIYYKGLSEITGVHPDSRDVGAVNYGTGNHLRNTVEGAMTEGFIYADKLIDMLLANSRWSDKRELLSRLVRAPIFSNEFHACGRVVLPGSYEYALDFHGTPPRMASWSDALLGYVRNDIFSGDMEGHRSGYFTVAAVGDKHFFASTYTEKVFYHMSASGTHTDQYGKKGFSPNNTGVSFVLLPVDGPENGPIITRTLSAPHLMNLFKKPSEFNWEEYLPNPV